MFVRSLGNGFSRLFHRSAGPLVDRRTHRSPWNYLSTHGMGLLEYLEWCKDLKVEPVLAVYAGHSLNGERVVGKQLEPLRKMVNFLAVTPTRRTLQP